MKFSVSCYWIKFNFLCDCKMHALDNGHNVVFYHGISKEDFVEYLDNEHNAVFDHGISS